MKVRSDDALFVDRLLNRGRTAEEVDRLAAETARALPAGYAAHRLAEREQQRKIKEALPDGIEQRTPEWYAARENFVTASDFYTAAFGTDAAKKRFVAGKAGQNKPFLGSAATRHGVKYEDWARLLYEREMGSSVREYGLLPHKTVDIMAASPDGIDDNGTCVEIKAPTTKTLSDVPPEYYAQMQGQMEVAELKYADFTVCRATELESDEFWPAFEAAHAAGYGYDRYGAIGSTRDETPKFAHSKPGLSPDELREWMASLPETMDVSTHHVFDFKITRIEHDPVYVADMIRELRETWKQVLEARASPTPVVIQPLSPALKGFAFKRFGA